MSFDNSGKPRKLPWMNPYVVSGGNTRSLMLDVITALIPAVAVAVYFFGPRVLLVAAAAIASAVLCELGYRAVMRKSVDVGDLSAVVTGLLLAMTLPVSVPYWVVAVGSAFAIIVVKQLYGGIGRNFVNPALAGRAFLFSFPTLINNYVSPGSDKWLSLGTGIDAATSPTPVQALTEGLIPANLSVSDMLLGRHGGAIGEVASLALILGGLYLVIRGVISLRIPVSFIGTVAVLTYLFPRGGDATAWMVSQLLTGGLLLGAIFMATDYASSPNTGWGQVIYGMCCGGLTVFLRYFSVYPEGVCFAILMMNCCAGIFDMPFAPRAKPGTLSSRRRLPASARKEGDTNGGE